MKVLSDEQRNEQTNVLSDDLRNKQMNEASTINRASCMEQRVSSI